MKREIDHYLNCRECESLDENTKKEILGLDSVLRDFLGLGIVWNDYGGEYTWDLNGARKMLGLGIVCLEDGSGRGWWYGGSLEDCFWKMMKDLKRGAMVVGSMNERVSLPRFGSVSELKMKMELMGKG